MIMLSGAMCPDENIWHETQRAPVAALKFLDDATKAMSGEVKELVINRTRALTCVDAEWSDEMNCWLARVGSTGEAVVAQPLLTLLTNKVAKDIASSIWDIKTLSDGKLYTFIGVES